MFLRFPSTLLFSLCFTSIYHMSQQSVIEVCSRDELSEEIGSNTYINPLVYFYSDSCSNCGTLEPQLENLSQTKKIIKINTDRCRDVSRDHNIPAGERFPTFVQYSGGRKGHYDSLYNRNNLDDLGHFSFGW